MAEGCPRCGQGIDNQTAYRGLARALHQALMHGDVAMERLLRERIGALRLAHCMWPEACDNPCRVGSAFCEAHYAQVVGYSQELNAETAQPVPLH